MESECKLVLDENSHIRPLMEVDLTAQSGYFSRCKAYNCLDLDKRWYLGFFSLVSDTTMISEIIPALQRGHFS